MSPRTPVVEIVEFAPCGVSIGWSTPAARTLVLEAIVEVVARFLGIPAVERIRLEPQFDWGGVVDAVTRAEFAAAAPTFICYERCRNPNKLWLNGRDSGFTLVHLDQSIAGASCQLSGAPCSDDMRDRFYDVTLAVLREAAAANPGVTFDFGPWGEAGGEAGEDAEGHYHVSVFHGADERYASGLVLHAAPGGWEIRDEVGDIGARDASYGVFPSEAAACREALRLLRARYGDPTRPCWGAGAPNRALFDLGYSRGRLRWRWWPPGLEFAGASCVGVDGDPALPSPG
jgi:hypothetical protein